MDLRFHALDVYFILKGINSSKAAGPDGIDGIVSKNCAPSLAKPLTLMFNTSFATGCIPGEWKLASVVAVHKKDDKGCVDNWQSFTLSIVTFTEINKTSGLFGKQEYFPHLQLFIVLHVAKRLNYNRFFKR